MPFSATVNGPVPDAQTLAVTAVGSAPVSLTESVTTQSGGNWLSVTSGTSTPANLTVTVNPAGLAPGTYVGNIVVTPATGAAQTVAVLLVVKPQVAVITSVSPSTIRAGSPDTAITIKGSGFTKDTTGNLRSFGVDLPFLSFTVVDSSTAQATIASVFLNLPLPTPWQLGLVLINPEAAPSNVATITVTR
jgi:hypothetical protein